jgi:hypothetical protein
VLAVFEALEKKQSSPYKAWRRLVSEKEKEETGARRYDKDELLKSYFNETALEHRLGIIFRSLPTSRHFGREARFSEQDDSDSRTMNGGEHRMLQWIINHRNGVLDSIADDLSKETGLGNIIDW